MAEDSKRLFIGIPVDLRELPALAEGRRQILIRAEKKNIQIRWSPLPNLHITLKFLGPTSTEKLGLLEEELAEAATAYGSFAVKVSGVGGFPDAHHARSIWAGVQKKRELRAIAETLSERLDNLGFPQESREYTPHITLGRLPGQRSVQDVISSFQRKKWGELQVNSFAIYESHIQSNVTIYKPLKRFDLKIVTSG